MTTPWFVRYAGRTRHLTSSTIRELLKLTQRPEVISFAGGMPAPELFPLERVREASNRILADSLEGQTALQYSATEGYPPLREMIARHTARYGILATPENVLITSGSQQALDLIAKLMIDPGDSVLVEAPTYLGALQAFNVFEPRYASVPVDSEGLRTDSGALDDALAQNPKFMYLLPNFQNPSGTTLSLERRRKLLDLADRQGIPIIEDDPYGQLRYEGQHVPPLLALDRQSRSVRRDNGFRVGNVIYLSTFSKTLAPGLRLGWMIAPPDVIGRLVQLKQGADLHTSTFTQQLVYEVARGGFLDAHIRRLRPIYRERRDVMLNALAEFMPPGVEWTRPAGGLFLWLSLPEGMDAASLLQSALALNVAFVPGSAFFADQEQGRRHCRLNFSNAQPERIVEGIQRLGEAMREQAAVGAI
jgi:2-aminoadipate transaminase